MIQSGNVHQKGLTAHSANCLLLSSARLPLSICCKNIETGLSDTDGILRKDMFH